MLAIVGALCTGAVSVAQGRSTASVVDKQEERVRELEERAAENRSDHRYIRDQLQEIKELVKRR
jgi:type II secretory pathway pseudopilin PulG